MGDTDDFQTILGLRIHDRVVSLEDLAGRVAQPEGEELQELYSDALQRLEDTTQQLRELLGSKKKDTIDSVVEEEPIEADPQETENELHRLRPIQEVELYVDEQGEPVYQVTALIQAMRKCPDIFPNKGEFSPEQLLIYVIAKQVNGQQLRASNLKTDLLRAIVRDAEANGYDDILARREELLTGDRIMHLESYGPAQEELSASSQISPNRVGLDPELVIKISKGPQDGYRMLRRTEQVEDYKNEKGQALYDRKQLTKIMARKRDSFPDHPLWTVEQLLEAHLLGGKSTPTKKAFVASLEREGDPDIIRELQSLQEEPIDGKVEEAEEVYRFETKIPPEVYVTQGTVIEATGFSARALRELAAEGRITNGRLGVSSYDLGSIVACLNDMGKGRLAEKLYGATKSLIQQKKKKEEVADYNGESNGEKNSPSSSQVPQTTSPPLATTNGPVSMLEERLTYEQAANNLRNAHGESPLTTEEIRRIACGHPTFFPKGAVTREGLVFYALKGKESETKLAIIMGLMNEEYAEVGDFLTQKAGKTWFATWIGELRNELENGPPGRRVEQRNLYMNRF